MSRNSKESKIGANRERSDRKSSLGENGQKAVRVRANILPRGVTTTTSGVDLVRFACQPYSPGEASGRLREGPFGDTVCERALQPPSVTKNEKDGPPRAGVETEFGPAFVHS